MKYRKKKAFTLTELLVVVVIVGVLSAVALPKFNRAIETRKTGEAEEMMAAVRTEQEKRCELGKNYAVTFGQIGELTAFAGKDVSSAGGGNYTYSLQPQGVSAASTKGYTLKIPSYKSGRLCCEGAYCDKLNKDYPPCADIPAETDECADTSAPPETVSPCDANPNQPGCCAAPLIWVESAGQCLPKISCTGDWVYDASDNRCVPPACSAGSVWNAETGKCEPEPVSCHAVYGAWKTVSSGTASDTCPGADARMAYTCTDAFKGICTDVRSATATTTAQGDKYEPYSPRAVAGGGVPGSLLADSCPGGDNQKAYQCDGSFTGMCLDVSNASATGIAAAQLGDNPTISMSPDYSGDYYKCSGEQNGISRCPQPPSGSFINNNGSYTAFVSQGSVDMSKYCLAHSGAFQDGNGITNWNGLSYDSQYQPGGLHCIVYYNRNVKEFGSPEIHEFCTTLTLDCRFSATLTKVTCAEPQKEYEDVRTVNCCSSTASTEPEGPVTSVPSVTSQTVPAVP